MEEKESLLSSELSEAKSVIAALQAENDGLKGEIARLRSLLRSRDQHAMSTKLKDALRE
ncbi:hypothetical protein PAECIP111893_05051 [Paenibacillus plantiphilus]|uniref:Transposase n=1 Tax=Paenibacillus plantiphilus TaxID=2905650 RepID=A0ABM9CUF7_9BACL|nr:hypothetical protein [Paenibacillus plantiphilus]CAH1223937.1 hypothetical protein PAECIP111893_05051 [Paenibacillus plantiphilus]